MTLAPETALAETVPVLAAVGRAALSAAIERPRRRPPGAFPEPAR